MKGEKYVTVRARKRATQTPGQKVQQERATAKQLPLIPSDGEPEGQVKSGGVPTSGSLGSADPVSPKYVLAVVDVSRGKWELYCYTAGQAGNLERGELSSMLPIASGKSIKAIGDGFEGTIFLLP